jgi:EpsI family protein
MTLPQRQVRFLVATALLLSAALFLQAHSRIEILPPHRPLADFALHLGDWTGTDIPISPDIREVLGPGDFLLRVYQNDSGTQPYFDLFIAFFPSQRAGDTIHSPKNCLPGAGWSPVKADRILLTLPGASPFQVNRYLIAKGDQRQLVLYWYLAHNRTTASEYWAKFYLVADSMRMNRSDGSLIRITTPIARGDTMDAAQHRLVSAASYIVPQLGAFIPR